MRSPSRFGMPLSAGQLAALRLVASGYSSRQIAHRLNSTEQGIHLRLQEAAIRLGARSRTHAVVIALRSCVIRFDDIELPRPDRIRPTPAQEAPGGAVSAPRGSGAPGLLPQGSKAPQGAVQGLTVHDGPSTAECAADDRRWPLQKHGE